MNARGCNGELTYLKLLKAWRCISGGRQRDDAIAAQEKLSQLAKAAAQRQHLRVAQTHRYDATFKPVVLTVQWALLAQRQAVSTDAVTRHSNHDTLHPTCVQERLHSLRINVRSRLPVASLGAEPGPKPCAGSARRVRLRSSCRSAGSCRAIARPSRQLATSVPERSSSASAGAAPASSPSGP